VHIAIPVGVGVLLSVLPYMVLPRKIMIFVLLTAAISGLVQCGFLMSLQASACKGVKDYRSILTAAGICAFLTAGMVALPAYIESMRLTVSQLFGAHKSLLTPAMARINNVITTAGGELVSATTPDPVQKGGAALTYIEYEAQEFKEIMIGGAYWAAFAGAYGVGIGSMAATNCNVN